ncbi:N-acetylmuramoyl-L-alanine amidase family protein [Halalkalibacter oceani]|uniref:N-acetylmuramoyl-L-alanine amidase family protein n=1 Tax=Halalkalibacter oceani TaxID=1653776 RepID=UPI00339640E4
MKKWLTMVFLPVVLLLFLSFPFTAYTHPYIIDSYDVVIDVGHGGIDGGTSANGVLEKDLNLLFGQKLMKELRQKSYHVGITRLHDYSLSDDSPFPHLRRHMRDLTQRKLIADALKPKVFISLHVNWSKHNKRRGPVIIYQVSGKSYHLARIVQEHLNSYYNMKKRPQKGTPYFLMKHLDMPSIIVELGYISNREDFRLLTDEKAQHDIVAVLVHAIEEYLLLYPADEA